MLITKYRFYVLWSSAWLAMFINSYLKILRSVCERLCEFREEKCVACAKLPCNLTCVLNAKRVLVV